MQTGNPIWIMVHQIAVAVCLYRRITKIVAHTCMNSACMYACVYIQENACAF